MRDGQVDNAVRLSNLKPIITMKKLRNTYGVNGMMEFQAVLKVGKTNLKVQFSDGSFNASSRKPATYTTDDLMVQHAIENSAEFKRGLIHKVSSVELDEEVKVLRNGRKAQNEPNPAEIKAGDSQEPASEPANAASGESASEMSEPDEREEIAKEASAEVANEPANETANPASELKQIEVNCNDDAKAYLADNFGVVKSRLLNRATIVSVAASYGIEFVFV